jgi:hypothetical protein
MQGRRCYIHPAVLTTPTTKSTLVLRRESQQKFVSTLLSHYDTANPNLGPNLALPTFPPDSPQTHPKLTPKLAPKLIPKLTPKPHPKPHSIPLPPSQPPSNLPLTPSSNSPLNTLNTNPRPNRQSITINPGIQLLQLRHCLPMTSRNRPARSARAHSIHSARLRAAADDAVLLREGVGCGEGRRYVSGFNRTNRPPPGLPRPRPRRSYP